jgi:hypothetical protein
LLFFVSDSLIPQITHKIQHWNVRLGLEAENDAIYWGPEEEEEEAG